MKKLLKAFAKKTTVLLVVAALVICTVPALFGLAGGGDLVTAAIVNGDFENGTEGYINVDTATFEVIAEPEKPSNHVLHLVGGNTDGEAGKGSYYQLVSVEKNTDYVWKFRMKDLGSTGSTRIYV